MKQFHFPSTFHTLYRSKFSTVSDSNDVRRDIQSKFPVNRKNFYRWLDRWMSFPRLEMGKSPIEIFRILCKIAWEQSFFEICFSVHVCTERVFHIIQLLNLPLFCFFVHVLLNNKGSLVLMLQYFWLCYVSDRRDHCWAKILAAWIFWSV